MKYRISLIGATLVAASSSFVFAQGGDQSDPGGRPIGPGGGRRSPPPIIAALDLNRDGVISADEIAKAADSLKKLDKNGDGQLTPDEWRPPRPLRPQDQDQPSQQNSPRPHDSGRP
jgi:hypothetical protein